MKPLGGGPSYWFNQNTNESSWEKPVARPHDETTAAWWHRRDRRSGKHLGEMGVWSEMTDAEGQTYFYNRETKQSAWEPPAGGFQVAAPPASAQWGRAAHEHSSVGSSVGPAYQTVRTPAGEHLFSLHFTGGKWK